MTVMPISLFIDNNVWDLFLARGIDLLSELPPNEFAIRITREAEFEIPLMPLEKRQYVEEAIKVRNVKTDMYFGFYDESLPPDQQRVGGFGDKDNPGVGGRFASEEEQAILRRERMSIGTTKRPTGLFKNEADVSLAARSAVSVVLTCDGKRSLKRARDVLGGAVIDLKKWHSEESLADFIHTEIASTKNSNG
ncbi:MAG: hypothetical protein OQK94_00995 [Gammaproteobacteria bacterium]|nr:hypothetical protein [Gammaproteobacteria bacterium]MCW8958911.1 hypothetical protein [Gammaproteobacteria bacterium]